MQIWVVSVVILFVGIQAYQWLSHLALPLPIYGVAGVLLAIASNSTGLRLPTPSAPSLTPPPEPPSSIPSPPKPSISFKISRD
ncbi:hypothetical protein [Spirulina major]|uniref:hypothetical protein n=1 Tax=Spirulina major TaxID=270636 RepID=UPI0009322CE5|nr:hypothetical protein [Spirulina major]